jgi:hypothetical protein
VINCKSCDDGLMQKPSLEGRVDSNQIRIRILGHDWQVQKTSQRAIPF